MVHGFMGWCYTWRKTFRRSPRRDITFMRPTCRASGSRTAARYSVQLRNVLRRAEPVHGCKKNKTRFAYRQLDGGGVAIRFAIDHPDRVNKLISWMPRDNHDRNVFFKIITIPVLNSFIGSLMSRASVMASMKQPCFMMAVS